MIDVGLTDRTGRHVRLRPIDDDNWRDVADVAPRDDQRDFVNPSAARYMLLSAREGEWKSQAVLADDEVVGHVMWGWDEDDGTYWIGGMIIDASQQGAGVGRATVRTLARWLMGRPDCKAVRLSVHPDNRVARSLYGSIGFRELDIEVDGETVAELTRERLDQSES